MTTGTRIGFVFVLLASACLSASAAELAALRNGFAIRHERHEVRGDVTRLYMTAATDNYVEIPTVEILSYEEIVTPAVAVPDPIPAPALGPTLDAAVDAASNHNNIDKDLILSVIRAESGFNPNAISPKGAQGLMQLMPLTAAQLGVQNPLDPTTNVEGGARYLSQLLARYNYNLALALAAYNAGPERVEQYRGVPPYRETRVYVSRVIRDFNRKKSAQRSPRQDAGSRTIVEARREKSVSLP
jgi:soluble lytic murein transglycosylase-like protein